MTRAMGDPRLARIIPGDDRDRRISDYIGMEGWCVGHIDIGFEMITFGHHLT